MRGRNYTQTERLFFALLTCVMITAMFWYKTTGDVCQVDCVGMEAQQPEDELELKPTSQRNTALLQSDMEAIWLEMKRRQLTVLDECHADGGVDVDNILSQANFHPVVKRLLVDRKRQLAWCPTFKAGSSVIMHMFAAMGGMLSKENLQKLKYGRTQINNLANRAYPPIQLSRPNLELLAKFTRFMVVRHPFERLLSAYRDKLEHRENREYYYRKYGREIVRTQRGTNISKSEPTFVEFLKFIVNKKVFDEHWRPYYWQCAPCYIDYQIILKTESLDMETQFLAEKFSLLSYLPNNTRSKNTNPNGRTYLDIAQSYYSTVPKRLLTDIYEIYEPDFRLFEYAANEYFKFAMVGD